MDTRSIYDFLALFFSQYVFSIFYRATTLASPFHSWRASRPATISVRAPLQQNLPVGRFFISTRQRHKPPILLKESRRSSDFEIKPDKKGRCVRLITTTTACYGVKMFLPRYRSKRLNDLEVPLPTRHDPFFWSGPDTEIRVIDGCD